MRRYRQYHYVIVGADFHSEGGAWKSIYQFFRHREQSGERCLLVDLRRGDGMRQWLAALCFSPRVIVNGMAALTRWSILIPMLLRRDIVIYLHDTGYMLDAMLGQHPWKYRLLAHLLRTRQVLCVSQQMVELYRRRFGSQRTRVVYEVTEQDPTPVLVTGKKHIMMVGTLNRRKGFPLFLRVAELAAMRGLPWQFHWVGALGEADLGDVPACVKWWGWRESAGPLLEQADLFFLSSIDDPQPLSCLEALALGKRAVVYAGTGSAELVKGYSGCRVFSDYCPEAALQELGEALGEDIDCVALRAALVLHCSVEAFEDRLNAVFAAVPATPKPVDFNS